MTTTTDAATPATDRPARGGKGPARGTTRPPAAGSPKGGAGRPPTDTRPGDAPARPNRLPWVLAIAGLVGTLVFGMAWRAEKDAGAGSSVPTAAQGPTAELLDQAREFSLALTNFDAATVDRDFDRIMAMSTGEFLGQADRFFSTEIRTQLKEAQASSRGEVRSAYVQKADGDRGTVFVVVDQTIANNQTPQPRADTLRMEVGLVREDGAWKVERVAVLTAPSGGPADAATTEPAE